MSFQTPLGRVKKLGSAKSGTSHFIHQRFSAVFLIYLVTWALYFFVKLSHSGDDFIKAFTNFDLVTSLVFVGAFLYHGSLGLQVVFEDYIHCKKMLNATLILTKFVCVFTFAAYLLSVCSIKSQSLFIEILK